MNINVKNNKRELDSCLRRNDREEVRIPGKYKNTRLLRCYVRNDTKIFIYGKYRRGDDSLYLEGMGSQLLT